MAYPVQVELSSPSHFERIQLLLRLVLAVALGWIGITGGWVMWALYLALPVLAAIVVSTQGTQHYVEHTGPRLWRALGWLLAFSAYMLLLVDRFPVGEASDVRIELVPTAKPTASSALLRLVTSIPSGIVLALLSVVSGVVFVIGALAILLGVGIPSGALAFQRGIVRWQARLLAYHASLVDEYPPFSFGETNAWPGDRAKMV
jgi:hypothetical protein